MKSIGELVMAYEQKDMEGSLFKNDKQGNETWPDVQGTIRINGKDYYLSGWVNQPKDGKVWRTSLKAKPKAPEIDLADTPEPRGDFNDEIPF